LSPTHAVSISAASDKNDKKQGLWRAQLAQRTSRVGRREEYAPPTHRGLVAEWMRARGFVIEFPS
jgi:hypothetical protein